MTMTRNLPERRELDPDFTWNLESLFKSERDYETALNKATDDVKPIAAMQGKLNSDNLFDFLEQLFELNAAMKRCSAM